MFARLCFHRAAFRPLPRRMCMLLLLAIAATPVGVYAHETGDGPPLVRDGIHDPSNPSLHQLQEPNMALGSLPPAKVGDGVDWVAALERGEINPRKGVDPNAVMSTIDMDVLMDKTASMPAVTFPHFQHTQWLGCSNCHPAIFLPKREGNPVDMYSILKGEFCGVCHGKVAFPVTNCFRCHDTPKDPRSLPR